MRAAIVVVRAAAAAAAVLCLAVGLSGAAAQTVRESALSVYLLFIFYIKRVSSGAE